MAHVRSKMWHLEIFLPKYQRQTKILSFSHLYDDFGSVPTLLSQDCISRSRLQPPEWRRVAGTALWLWSEPCPLFREFSGCFNWKILSLPSFLLIFTNNTDSITFKLKSTWLTSNFLHLWHTMTLLDAVNVCDYTEKLCQVDSEWPLVSRSAIAWLCSASLCSHSNISSISFYAGFIKRKQSCLSVKKKKREAVTVEAACT